MQLKLHEPNKIYMGHVLTSEVLAHTVRDLKVQPVIIADEQVAQLHAAALLNYFAQHDMACHALTFPAGEAHKNRDIKASIEDALAEKGYKRDICVVALGGGVTLDLAGFVAATYCRGVPSIYVPTSLLAMVDAAIGGKTAVNTPYAKNFIGCFRQPHAVLVDSQYLKTINALEYQLAFAEIIKHAVIADRQYADFLLRQAQALLQRDPDALAHTIGRSIEIKTAIVAQDAHDYGIRHVLNFGHTIAHALEALYHYQIPHGQSRS